MPCPPEQAGSAVIGVGESMWNNRRRRRNNANKKGPLQPLVSPSAGTTSTLVTRQARSFVTFIHHQWLGLTANHGSIDHDFLNIVDGRQIVHRIEQYVFEN